MPEMNTFCWNELNAKYAAAGKEFYGIVFGWTAHDQLFGPMTYTIFKKGDTQVAGMLQMTAEWGDIKPHWMPYIAVEDCDACAHKTVASGGKVCVPPSDISVGRSAVVEDPNGSFFSIIRLNTQIRRLGGTELGSWTARVGLIDRSIQRSRCALRCDRRVIHRRIREISSGLDSL
jgi:uncharacterized protein